MVYAAEDVRLKRRVALKFLPPHLSTDADAKARFMLEAEAALGRDRACVDRGVAVVNGASRAGGGGGGLTSLGRLGPPDVDFWRGKSPATPPAGSHGPSAPRRT